MKEKIEKNSRVILGIMSIILLLMFIAFSLGSQTWMRIIMIATGILVSALLFSESAIISYIKTKKYKKFSLGDIVVIVTVILATGIFFNSLFQIPLIYMAIPKVLLDFTTTTAVITGVGGIIFSLIHIFNKKFE
jgi:hypothetical protein